MAKGTLSIIAPIAEEDFFDNYYEKKLLHISRNNPNYFDDIINLEDIDSIIDSGHLYYPDFNLKKKEGQNALQPWLNDALKNPTLKINQGELYRQVAAGQTLIINTIEKWLPKFNHFMVSMGNRLGVEHSANVYITPPKEQGFSWHYDDHDVCILQIMGNKVWSLIEEDSSLPDANFKSKSPRIEAPEHSTQIILKAGDMLYIPRGMYHKAVTEDVASVHVTLAIHSVKRYQLFDHFIEEVRKEKLFRKSILSTNTSNSDKQEILNAAKEFAIDYFSNLDLSTAEKTWDQSIARKVASVNKNRLTSILEINNLNLNSEVRLNPNVILDVSSGKKFVEIKANGKELKYPIFMQQALMRLLDTNPVLLKKLVKEIPEKHLLDLAKKLITEGFIIIEH